MSSDPKPTESSSKAPTTTTTTEGVAEAKPQDASNTHIGILEEDDEFEEFPVADWDNSETDIAHLGGQAPGLAMSGGDKLWEDNWDDDDIEDDFSVQLRNELAKTGKKSSTAPDAMQH